MKGNEFTKAIEGLGLSQVEAARLFGTYPSTVCRWINGELSVPWPVYHVVWCIEKYKVNHYEVPSRPTRAEQKRLDMEEFSRMVSGGPVAFTRRQPPTKS